MSQNTPTIVTVAQQFSGQYRSIPHAGGHVTQAELQNLANRLRDIIKTTAVLADTVEQVRVRAVREAELSLSESANSLQPAQNMIHPR